MEQWTLYYDGGCNLCHTTQLRLERWAAKRNQPLHVDILQSDKAIQKGYTLEGLVLEIDGKPHVGYDGWLESMKVAPWPLRWLYSLRKISLFRSLAKFAYGIVAKYRLKWFGSRSCPIPTSKA